MKGVTLRACAELMSLALTTLFLSGCWAGTGLLIGSQIDADRPTTIDTANTIAPEDFWTLSAGDSVELLFRDGTSLRSVYDSTELQNMMEYGEGFAGRIKLQPDGRQWPAPGDTIWIWTSVRGDIRLILAGYDTSAVICIRPMGGGDEVRVLLSETDSIRSTNGIVVCGSDAQDALRSGVLPLPYAVWVHSGDQAASYPLEAIGGFRSREAASAALVYALVGLGLEVSGFVALLILSSQFQ